MGVRLEFGARSAANVKGGKHPTWSIELFNAVGSRELKDIPW
jgi:hypothetical protein